jgi:apolipoprotein D and lipocalin family protein
MIRTILILIAMISFLSCKPANFLQTVEKVDIEKYTGQWYEIARLPNSFEKNLECVTANYSVKKNGKIEVLNKGYSSENKSEFKTARGTAWVPDPQFPGQLKVSFFWPFAGDYYIISLDEDYKYVLVGDPSRKYLWILSRTKILDSAVYSKLLEIARQNGFEIENILKINQGCE